VIDNMPEYVYGVVARDARPPNGRGITDAPLRLIGSDGAAALVSWLEGERPVLGREDLETHVRVLTDALSCGAVLPMRAGVVMSDAEEVRQRLLERHAPELRRQLDELADKVEMRVRATYEEGRLMREVVLEHPDIARLRQALHGRPDDATYYQRIDLGERVAGAVERKRALDVDQILDTLAPVTLDAGLTQPAHERIALSASFLVARDRLTEFDRALDGLGQAQAGRMRFKCTGPLAPHSFVELLGEV
jgi:hypothetical protein